MAATGAKRVQVLKLSVYVVDDEMTKLASAS
jgi:hypothetical protein